MGCCGKVRGGGGIRVGNSAVASFHRHKMTAIAPWRAPSSFTRVTPSGHRCSLVAMDRLPTLMITRCD